MLRAREASRGPGASLGRLGDLAALRCLAAVAAVAAVAISGPLTAFASAPAAAVGSARPPGGSYVPLTPSMIVDTRTGLGDVPTGPTRTLVVDTAGRAGIPAAGVSAVAVNITAIGGSVSGFVTAYPTGSARPQTSNVPFASRQNAAQMAVVPVSRAGQLTLAASAPAQLALDVEGYFTTPGTATASGLFNPLDPARIMDSRSGLGGAAPGPGGLTSLQVTGRGGVPATGVSAVVVNTTVTGPTRDGFVTDFAAASPRPSTSTVGFRHGQTVANRAIVPLGAGGRISIFNAAGTTQVVVDVTGFFTDGRHNTAGGYYVPLRAARLVDTRFWRAPSYRSTRTVRTQRIAGQTCVLSPDRTVCGGALVPPVTATPRPIAALLTITAAPRGSGGHLTAFAADAPVPLTSDVSFSDGPVANLAFVSLGARGEVSVKNSGAAADVMEDVCGYFVLPPPSQVSLSPVPPSRTPLFLGPRSRLMPAAPPNRLPPSGRPLTDP